MPGRLSDPDRFLRSAHWHHPSDDTNLPPGDWISFLGLPPTITPQDLSTFFESIFPFPIPPERIYVGPMLAKWKGNRCVISFDKEMVRQMVKWILMGHQISGYEFTQTEAKQ